MEEMILETFTGYVDKVEGDTAYFTLESRDYGDVLCGHYSASELAKKGIGEQCSFLCRTVKVNGIVYVDIKFVPPHEVTDEEVREIEEEIERAFPQEDPGISY